jgi:hypothetical protein
LFDRKLAVDGERGCISTVEVVVMRPPEVFVRSLSHQEAVRLKRMSTRAEHQATRIRSAILLASNVKTITHRNGRDHDRRIAALERKHRVAA